ncbi:endoplasmic reticulum-Golgi intermediate compartment protein 3-like isoform X2 [Macadamia integrifolia]|nr:endoplasmic reticulum-Golgi intermediate compartment protein 3-like isoform X2 [Macadamia integrifolia]XP_042486975.1 endoplasmic reticulum-Golgi intermediate compartment protein 3-like isoform X2 [Macadamia integrifolia]
MYQYFIKVVPTIYTNRNGRRINSNQVTFTEEKESLLHFLTNICAIVGGMFTLSGIVDTYTYHGQLAMKKVQVILIRERPTIVLLFR